MDAHTTRTRWEDAALVFAAVLVLEIALLLVLGGFDRPPWGDEGHFVSTIRLFAEDPAAVVDYPEVVPPLSFYLYAGWGALLGDDLARLRLLSILLAGLAGAMQFLLLRRFVPRGWAFAGAAYLALTPYFFGAGAFVYTDMLFQVLTLAVVLAALNGRVVLYGLAAALLLLTRQYGIAFVAAVGLFGLLRGVKASDRASKQRGWGFAAVSALAVLPLAVLMGIWGGLSPPAGLAKWTLDEPLAWHPSHFTMLVAMGAIYLAPWVVWTAWRWRKGLTGAESWLRSLPWATLAVAVVFYVVFPVRASRVTVEQLGIDTVGYVHKALHAALPGWAVDGVLLLAFVAGFRLLGALLDTIWRRWREGVTARPAPTGTPSTSSTPGATVGEPEAPVAAPAATAAVPGTAAAATSATTIVLLGLLLMAYLLLLPLSYQSWEKYLLPVLPIGLALLLAGRMPGTGSSDRSDTRG